MSSLAVVANGGALLTPYVKQRLIEVLPNAIVVDGVGSSETGGADASHVDVRSGVDGHIQRRSGYLRRRPKTSASILQPGHDGMGWLAQRGYVPLGYKGDAAKTAATFPVIDGVRYAVPGDRARHRDDGRIELLGRDSVTINSGGEKIFVEEVETAIASHPAVVDVVVTGRPSERWGQEVVAVVALADGANADADELIAHAATVVGALQASQGDRIPRRHRAQPVGQGRLPVGARAGGQRVASVAGTRCEETSVSDGNDFNERNIAEFRANHGRVGGQFEGAPLVLLHTVGAKSGKPRTNIMMYLADGDRYLIFASKAGADENPAWYWNLKANPDARIEVGDDTVDVRATELQGAERDEKYALQAERYPGFADYEHKTSRTIPVVALTPTGQPQPRE